jgi:hypothetical protein
MHALVASYSRDEIASLRPGHGSEVDKLRSVECSGCIAPDQSPVGVPGLHHSKPG